MKCISLDFSNKMICFMTDGQQGTELYPEMEKEKFSNFIPEKFYDRSSFTWNFENETFAVNQEYVLQDGAIMTKDCFTPQVIIPMAGLRKQYKRFISILGYEEINFVDEMPESLRKFLGLG